MIIRIQELVENPGESLAVELKGWIDPKDPKDAAKIVKTAIAMRNNDGGTLLIGFDNNKCKPLASGAPNDIESLFHVDEIQGLIAKHSSEPFEVDIHLVEIEGRKYPIIDVPSGVKSPVVVKKPIIENGTTVLSENKVFVRTLTSNNTPSTSEARVQDWPRLIEICFENREADIGRFIRRHLSAITPETVSVLSELFKKTNAPPMEERLMKFMNHCLSSYERAKKRRASTLPNHGSWEVALIIDGEGAQFQANLDFLQRITATIPHHTGWPLWLDTTGFSDEDSHPYVLDKGWEALIVTLGSSWADHIDFMRWEPVGQFYQRRALEDDVSPNHPEPLTQLDFSLAILRSAEAVLVGRAIAKAMEYEESATLHFGFRWNNLSGRILTSWVHPRRFLRHHGKSEQDSVYKTIAIPLSISRTAIAPYVMETVNELFSHFGGFSISLTVVEEFVQRLIENRL